MKVAAIIIGVLILLAVLWDASERHYDNCIRDRSPQGLEGWADTPDERRERVKGDCSRLPF